MKLAILFSITLICYANSLSLEFTATESPTGISSHGGSKIQAVCDPSRKCGLPTQSRSQCIRFGCCWHPTSNKCVSKKYFILDLVVRECQYVVVEQTENWATARKYCQDRGWDLIQRNPKFYNIQGRQEIAATLDLPMGSVNNNNPHPYTIYHTGIVRDETDIRIFKRVSDGRPVELSGWRTHDPSRPDSKDFPLSDADRDVLAWRAQPIVVDDNRIFNTNVVRYFPFICEY